MKFLWITLFSFLLAACGGGGGGDAAGPQAPQADGGGQVINATIKAAAGSSYALSIYLPASYASTTATLPVVYVTEADAPYGTAAGGSGYSAGFSGASRFEAFKQAVQRRGAGVILVGIGGTDRRNTDFLLPTAENYLAFLGKELVPYVEQRYRADPGRRALSGLSHGGYFVIAALVLEARQGQTTFSHYLSTDTSFGTHAGQAGLLQFEKELDAQTLKTPVTLLLAGAAADGTTNGRMVKALYDQMLAHAHAGLTLHHTQLSTTHVGADVPAFEDALKRYFP